MLHIKAFFNTPNFYNKFFAFLQRQMVNFFFAFTHPIIYTIIFRVFLAYLIIKFFKL